MARPAYKITKADFAIAVEYLEKHFSHSGGFMVLRQCSTPDMLQGWCDDYLTAAEWKKLKQVIWATRKRNKAEIKPKQKPKNITISHQAWSELSELAEGEGITLSHALVKYIAGINRMSEIQRREVANYA